MRYLRLYKNDSAFKTAEQTAGGTGNDVESIVPGIVKTVDERKMYFNPYDKTVQFHTLTIYYENSNGEQLAECKTMTVKYMSGVTQEIVVTPKNIDGYIARKQKIVANIPEDTSIVFYYNVKPDYSKPLTFNIISAGTIDWFATNTACTKTVKYKKNNGEWTTITSNTRASAPSISVSAGDVLQFKGDNATYAANPSYYNWFGGTAKFEVEGNIMSLINSTNFATATTLVSSYTFYRLFYYRTGLTSAENLVLPATTLADWCYYDMFYNCTSLTSAPELPATTLANNCYDSMFYGCTSLTSAPELPATTLADWCYDSMFYGCTSLTSAPELPATTLASSCYYGMFRSCTSLTTAPELPATTLANNCYGYMFQGCTSLTTAPELPVTTLTDYCYRFMFGYCANLSYIKCLATDKSASYCTDNWVNGVASTGTFVKNPNMSSWLTGVNGIPTNWTVVENGISVSMKNVVISKSGGSETFTISSTEGNWTATTSDNWIVLSQLTGNTGETNVTITLSSTVNERTGSITFTDGINVSILPVNQIDYVENYLTFTAKANGTFKFSGSTTANTLQYSLDNGTTWNNLAHNTNTPTVQSGNTIIFKGNLIPQNYGGIGKFISSGLFDVEGNIMSLLYNDDFSGQTTLSTAYAFTNLFNGCTGLIAAENLSLPATTLANNCYDSMFYGCTSLTSAPELPATTLANSCYGSMFRNCTSLTTAPELPATTLARYCYRLMFARCTSLSAITCLASDISAYDCTYNWVSGVASTGTFEKSSSITEQTWGRGTSGIPNNWTIVDAT